MLLCRGEEVVKNAHVAIPTVTYTSNLVYHQKVEKTPVFYNFKSHCINGMMNHLSARKKSAIFPGAFLLLTVDKGVGLIFLRYSALSTSYQFVLDTNNIM